MNEVDQIRARFHEWAHAQRIEPALLDVEVESLGVPHKPKSLPKSRQGVYAFQLGKAWLKVGKAGPNSNARWVSQHYKATRSLSNLAWSLFQYAHLSSFEHPSLPVTLRDELKPVHPDQIGDWIKQHTARVNFLIKAEVGPSCLSQLERIAQVILKPVFEGRWNRESRPTPRSTGPA